MDQHLSYRSRSHRMRSFLQDFSDTVFSLASQLTSDVVAELNEAMAFLIARKQDCFHQADKHLETALEIALTYYSKRCIKSSRTGRDDVVLSNEYLSRSVSDIYALRACLNDHMQNFELSRRLAGVAVHFNSHSWFGYWRLAVAHHRTMNKGDANLALNACFKAIQNLDFSNEFDASEARMFRRLERRRVHQIMRDCGYWFDKRVMHSNVHFKVHSLKHGLNKCVVVDTHGAGNFHTIKQALDHHRDDEQLTILLAPGLHYGPIEITESAREFKRAIEIVGMRTPFHGRSVRESTKHARPFRHEEGGYKHGLVMFEVDEEERSIRDCIAFLSLFVKNPEADEDGRLEITTTNTQTSMEEIMQEVHDEDHLYNEAVVQSIGEPALVLGAPPANVEHHKSSDTSPMEETKETKCKSLLVPVKLFLWRFTLKRLPSVSKRRAAFVVRPSDHPNFFSEFSQSECVVLMRDTRESVIASLDGLRITSPDLAAFGVHAWGGGRLSRFPLTLLHCEFDLGFGAVRAFRGGNVVMQSCHVQNQTACLLQLSHGSALRMEDSIVDDCGGDTDAVDDIGVHFGSKLALVRVKLPNGKFVKDYHFHSESRRKLEKREEEFAASGSV